MLPDETLFSWCSRYHRMAANGLASSTCMQLFGHRRIGTAHDFPSRIDTFVLRSDGVLGDAEEIIRTRTLLPYYLVFKDRDLANQAVLALRSTGIGSLKFQLGLLTSGFGAAHPLKSCPECERSDRSQYGWRYWHRAHQLPGVWVCLKHQTFLKVTPIKVDQLGRFEWITPGGTVCESLTMFMQERDAARQHGWLTKLGEISLTLLDCHVAAFANPAQISYCLMSRLQTLGLARPSGRICWSKVRPWLTSLSENMAGVPDFQRQNESLLQTQLGRMLAGRGLMHPLRYLIWVSLWFESLEDFSQTYQSAVMPLRDDFNEILVQTPTETVNLKHAAQSGVLESVRRGGLTVTAASRTLGVSYSTMAAWAARARIASPRRPKILDAFRWEIAINALREGQDKKEVARRCQISTVTVTRILRTVPDLQTHWHQMRQEERRVTARREWDELIQRFAQVGIKAIRQMAPATYAWLRRNDKDWLDASLTRVRPQVGSNNAENRMIRADAHLAKVLQRAIAICPMSTEDELLLALGREVPPIRNVLRYPARWPLTVRVLEDALGRFGYTR